MSTENSFHVAPPVRTKLAGVSCSIWTITERFSRTTGGSFDVAQEWRIDCLPTLFTISLFESFASGGTINPALGTVPQWSANTFDEVAANLKPSLVVRNGCSLRVTAPGSVLCGRSGWNAAGVPGDTNVMYVTTRITVVDGHVG